MTLLKRLEQRELILHVYHWWALLPAIDLDISYRDGSCIKHIVIFSRNQTTSDADA